MTDSEIPPPLPPRSPRPEAAPCPRCSAPVLPGETCSACVLAAAKGLGDQSAAPDGLGRPGVEELSGALPDYDVQVVIGRGGMGTVYRARHRKLDRMVAIKVLLPPAAAGASAAEAAAFTERFEREARVLARLDHPNIVRIHDFGTMPEPLGLHYLVLEYVEGANLRDLLRDGRLTPREVLELVPQICEGLQAAHRVGVIHRDIKPENILVDADGHVRIADFGLAKMSEGELTGLGLTRTSQTFGTLHYMAPEQVRGAGGVDHRADLYSLGVVLYEMLTGELPIGRFPAPSERAAGAKPFDRVVLKALESEPARRHEAASDVKRDLESAEQKPRSVRAVVGASSIGARNAGMPRLPDLSGVVRGHAISLLLFVLHFSDWLFATYPRGHEPGLVSANVFLSPFEASVAGVPLWWNWVLVFIAAVLRTMRVRGARIPTVVEAGLDFVASGLVLVMIALAAVDPYVSVLLPMFMAMIIHVINVALDLHMRAEVKRSAASARGARAEQGLSEEGLRHARARARARIRRRERRRGRAFASVDEGGPRMGSTGGDDASPKG